MKIHFRFLLIALIPFLLCFAWAPAQASQPGVSFVDARNYLGSNAAIADFTHDGIPDLVVASTASGELVFFAGNGQGVFSNPVVTKLQAVPQSLVAGDFNGDGVLDLGEFPNSNTIELLYGVGTGRFGAPVLLTPLVNLQDLVAADLNHDGLSDLTAVTDEPSKMAVLLNAGTGSFNLQEFSMAENLSGVNVADVNGDGNPDILLFGATTVYTYLGQGGGAFHQTSELAASGTTGVITDLNSDGIPDLALNDSVEVKIYLGDGTGAFAYPGEPEGVWFAVPGSGSAGNRSAISAAYLQSQSPSSGVAELLTLGTVSGGGDVAEMLNQSVAPQ